MMETIAKLISREHEVGLCSSCEKRGVCRTLCPEAELNVNQDGDSWGETPSVYFDQDGKELRVFDPVRGRDYSYLTSQEKKVLSLFAAGNGRVQIANILGISRVTLRKVIMRLREKTKELQNAG